MLPAFSFWRISHVTQDTNISPFKSREMLNLALNYTETKITVDATCIQFGGFLKLLKIRIYRLFKKKMLNLSLNYTETKITVDATCVQFLADFSCYSRYEYVAFLRWKCYIYL